MNTITDIDYKNLFDLNPLPQIVYDTATFRILDVNAAASELYGYSRSEFLSIKLDDFFCKNSVNGIDPSGKANGFTSVCHRKKDGSRIPLKVKSTDIIYDNRPARLETIIYDLPDPEEDYQRLFYSEIIETSDDAIISKDLNGKILSWNKGAEKMYGWKAKEAIGRNIDIIAPPDKKDEIRQILNTLKRGKRYDHYETRRQTKDGKVIWVEINSAPLKDSAGRIIGASSVARNISGTRETLARLEESEIIFKHLIENLSEVFYVSNPIKPEIIYISNAYEKVFGEPVHKIYQNPKAYLELISDEDLCKARRALAKQIKGIPTDYTYRIKRENGKVRYLRERAFPVKNKSGEVFRIIGVAEDITERIETENELKKSEYRYRSIFESTAVSMWEMDYTDVMSRINEIKCKGITDYGQYFEDHPEFVKECFASVRIVDVNPKTAMMFKANDKEHLINNFMQIRTKEIEPYFKEILIILANGGRHIESEYELKTFTGEPINVYSIMNFPDDNSPYQFTVASLIDITERKKAERALSESEQRFRIMADTAPVLIWTAGADKQFYYFNKPWLDFRGKSLDQESGEGWMNGINPIDLPAFKKKYDAAFKKMEEFRFEFRLLRHDGKERWLLNHGVPRFSKDGSFLGYIGSSVDITERKRNEVDLSKALASEKRALVQAEEIQHKLKYLAEASIILNSSLDYTETIQSLAQLLTPAVCDWFAVDLYINDKLERLVVYHKDPDKIQSAIDLQKKYPPDMNAETGVPDVIRTGKSFLYENLNGEFLKATVPDRGLYEIYRELGIRSIMILPLKVRGKILGAITLCTAESGKNYDQEDLKFAENIAHRAATAIDNASLFMQIQELNKNLEYTVRQQQNEIKFRKKVEKELRESEERFRLITENSNDFISLLDENDIYIFTNPAFTRVLGYNVEEIVGKKGPADFVYPEDRKLLKNSGSSSIIELRYLRKDGDYVWVESSSLKVNYHGKEVTIRISRDITERKRIENERVKLYSQLEAQRIRIDNLIANVPGVVWEAYGEPYAPDHKVDFISNYVEKLLGYSVGEWLSSPNFLYTILHPDDRDKAVEEAKANYAKKKGGIARFRWIAKNGSVIWVESQSTCICDEAGNVIGMRGVTMDITEQIKFEQQLSSSLKEKEILLKEIHHRVKNNMQVISSLLSLQAKTIPDKETQELFDESRNRIRSMALIHEKLYQSKDLFLIDFKSYVVDLLNNLMISYGFRSKNIHAEINIENITFDIDSAITMGLIINELASNAYKHAFKGRREGKIAVSVNKQNGSFVLIVKDNGVGLPGNVDVKRSESLGLQLVETLIDQLHGKCEIINNGGTEVRIEFPEQGGEAAGSK